MAYFSDKDAVLLLWHHDDFFYTREATLKGEGKVSLYQITKKNMRSVFKNVNFTEVCEMQKRMWQIAIEMFGFQSFKKIKITMEGI